MRLRILLMAVISWLLAGDATANKPGTALAELGWISGCWIHETEKVRSEECWMDPAGTLILGLHRDVRPGGKSFFEYLRIEQTDSAIVYFATPRGKETTGFPLKESTKNRVVFENLTHDFPQRVIYHLRDDGTMLASIEGLQDGELRTEEWLWHRGSITSK
jgi:hypothetical protein